MRAHTLLQSFLSFLSFFFSPSFVTFANSVFFLLLFINTRFPQIKANEWVNVFRPDTSREALGFVAATLIYEPTLRVSSFEVRPSAW